MAENNGQNKAYDGFRETYINLETNSPVAYEDINIQTSNQERNERGHLKTSLRMRRNTIVLSVVVLVIVMTQIAIIIILGLHMTKSLDHEPISGSQSSNEESFTEVRHELSKLNESLRQENVFTQCPSNWVVRERSCYRFSNDQQTWAESVVICGLFKGHLVVVNDDSENSFITSNKNDRRLWIGLNDLREEGSWKWLDSDAHPSYYKWITGEPNNADGIEQCVLHENDDGEWNDIQCQSLEHYVCEIELV